MFKIWVIYTTFYKMFNVYCIILMVIEYNSYKGNKWSDNTVRDNVWFGFTDQRYPKKEND